MTIRTRPFPAMLTVTMWVPQPGGGRQPVTGAYQDGGQAVWLHALA